MLCMEELCFGTDITMNPLGKGLELGGTACDPKKSKLKMVIFYRGGIVWVGHYLFEPLLQWEQTPNSDFKKDSTRSI